jgi:hypothetical protein
MDKNQEFRLLINKVEHLPYADVAEFWIWRIKDDFFPYRFFCLTTPRIDETTIFGVYPNGKYPVAIAHMLVHDVDHYEISGIAGHSGLFIHSGNTVADTKNCILVGEKLELPDMNGQYRLYNSRAAIKIMEDKLQYLPSEIWIYH